MQGYWTRKNPCKEEWNEKSVKKIPAQAISEKTNNSS